MNHRLLLIKCLCPELLLPNILTICKSDRLSGPIIEGESDLRIDIHGLPLTIKSVVKVVASVLTWRSNIFDSFNYSGDLKSDHLKSGLFEGRILNGQVFKWSDLSNGYSFSSNHSKTRPFQIRTFLWGFYIDFGKTAAICPNFKWLVFRISDPIRNPGYLHTSLFLTIWNLY